jgi:hypothetical protein
LVNIAFYGLIFVFSLYFQQINGWSSFATGLAFVPMMGAVLPVNLIAPKLAERFGAPAVVAAGALIASAGCLALLGIDRGTGYWAVFVQFLAMGGGLGMLVPPLTSALLGSVEKARSGLAAGVLNSTQRPRRRFVRIADRTNQRVPVRRARCADYLRGAADRRRGGNRHRRTAQEIGLFAPPASRARPPREFHEKGLAAVNRLNPPLLGRLTSLPRGLP